MRYLFHFLFKNSEMQFPNLPFLTNSNNTDAVESSSNWKSTLLSRETFIHVRKSWVRKYKLSLKIIDTVRKSWHSSKKNDKDRKKWKSQKKDIKVRKRVRKKSFKFHSKLINIELVLFSTFFAVDFSIFFQAKVKSFDNFVFDPNRLS